MESVRYNEIGNKVVFHLDYQSMSRCALFIGFLGKIYCGYTLIIYKIKDGNLFKVISNFVVSCL